MSQTKPTPIHATDTPAADAPPRDPLAGLTGVPRALAEALLAEPGAAAALLALAAGTSRPTTSRVLAAMEAEGLVRRESGDKGEGNGRRPDRWYLTATPASDAAPDGAAAATGSADPDGGTAAPIADNADEREAVTAVSKDGGEQSATDENGAPEPVAVEQRAEEPADVPTGGTDTSHAGPAALPDGQENVPGEVSDAIDVEPGHAPGESRDPAPGVGTPEPEAPTALATAQDAPQGGDAALPPVSGTGMPVGVACPTCGHTRRATAPRGSVGDGARLGQGQLHQLALDHLRDHPAQEWTATGIAKEISRSSGAIANALATMVTRGEAEMTCAAPRRFRAVTGSPVLAGGAR